MATESFATPRGEPVVAAERIQTGPVPEWVAACAFQAGGSEVGPVTHLLFDQQINAESREIHIHTAIRLNTMQAVQRESNWCIPFEPSQQHVTLHWIKTHRNGVQFEHSNLSSARILEAHASSGEQDRYAVALMLEDVRPGDILEWRYTIRNQPRILPDSCAALFTLPATATVSKYYFSVRFNPLRRLRWKSCNPDWKPFEDSDDGEISWAWTGENHPGLAREENTPAWHIAHPWIQVSDCTDWKMISDAFASAWASDDFSAVPAEITDASQAVRMVQEEFRCLPDEGELDGRSPQPASVVARRRYGNVKDLANLLANLLRRLGVPARLILVNSNYRKSLSGFLPGPGLFNHVLVECSLQGRTRWIDVTDKHADGRMFGLGLAVDGEASDLIDAPETGQSGGIYELKESLLLDTSGEWSRLAVVVTARGSEAAALRGEFEEEGIEAMARKRLTQYAARFPVIRRAGALEFRDDRAIDEFHLAEVFQIKDFLGKDSKPDWVKLEMANDFCAELLRMPDGPGRSAPFALPHPCHVVHIVELHSVALPPAVLQEKIVESPYVRFLRSRKTLAGYWTMKLTLTTLADAVPPEKFEEHRKTVKEIRSQSAWSILVPVGDARPRQRSDFGTLPAIAEPKATQKSGVLPPPGGQTSESPTTEFRRRKRSRKKERRARAGIILGCGLGLLLIVIAVVVALNADRWQIFKQRPTPPPTPDTAAPQ